MTISSPVIGPVTIVGNTSGGTDYNYEVWKEGKVIRKISVWETGNRMRGVKFWKSGEADNQGTVYGTASGTMSSYTFQAGELITSMSLWPGKWDYNGDRAGRIMFTTSLGNTFAHGYSGGGGEKVIDVFSGILVGANVRAGDDINCWGFAFLRPLVSCNLRDVTYMDLSGLGTLAPESLETLQTSNRSTVTVYWQLKGSKSKKVSSSWSQTEGLTFTMSSTVTAGMPEIGGAEGSFSWQVGSSQTSTSSFTTERSLEWSHGNEMKPQGWVDLQVMTYTGEISVPYKGIMFVTVDTGASFTFPQSGTYSGVSVTDVNITGKNGII